jgi:glycosyltransferase involved in cell wall biosynthesis
MTLPNFRSMFSVVIPVYNHQAFLEQAVRSALRSPLVAEVLLLDDGSRDASPRLAASFTKIDSRVRNLTKNGGGNRGAHSRLNELTRLAACEWIAVLNSDDVFVAGRFEAIASNAAFETADFVFGNLLLIDQRGSLVSAKRGPFDTGTPFPPFFNIHSMVGAGDFLELLSHQNYLGTTSNMIFRRSLHDRIGGFRDYRYVHDWDFALRAMALGRPLYIQKFLTGYRIHGQNTISEGQDRVDLESKRLFDRFTADFPDVAARSEFRRGLELNVNVGPSITKFQPALRVAL